MSDARWSLASRLTRLFAISTSVLVLVTTLVSGFYIWRSTENSIESLLKQEIDEMRFAYEQTADHKLLVEHAARLQAEQQGFPLAWRLWHNETEWGSFGAQGLFVDSRAPISPRILGDVQDLGSDLRALVLQGPETLRVGCIVDASSSLGHMRRFQAVGLILVLTTIVIIFVVGHVLVGRVALALRQLAESVRNVRAADGTWNLELGDASIEIREIVSALQEMLTNVRAEAERNRVFTASLAHELRSPIQNLMGETEVALMTTRDGAEYKRVLTSHLQELRDLADAVDNLVTICSHKKDGSDVGTTRESFDLGPEAKLRLARESAYALARGVQLHLESQGDTRLYGDREGLLRAMRNLTANAIEWSDPGGQVDVQMTGENGRVVVTVDDAGPGVPEELKERIFEAFFRGPQAKGRRIGYGLGLAIVRSAVDSQGGEIEVSRSPKGGARFCLRLPRNLHLPPSDDTPVP